MNETSSKEARGVYAASLTPMTAAGEPDVEAFLAHSRWLLAEGCNGLGILGTTGEANSLPLTSRIELIAAAAAKFPPEKLMPGTGSSALADAIVLTEVAVAAGAYNVLVLPPFYYKPASEEGIYRFFARLIEAVGDGRLRIFLYNFPQLTGFSFSVAFVGRLVTAFPEVIAGMKDSSGDYAHMEAIAKAFPSFAMFAGTEKFLLPILRAGGVGCITATANATARLCQDVYTGWRTSDAKLEAAQARLSAARTALEAFPMVPVMKSFTAMRTGDKRWLNMLPPNVPLAPADEAKLATVLAQIKLPNMPPR